MAGKLILAGSLALAALVAVGTWLYVSGIAPSFPWNARAFNLLLLVTLAWALLFGRHPNR